MGFSKVVFYFILPSLFSLSACHSSYEPYSLRGGYKERRIDAQTLVLEFKGNSYTSLQDVKALALRRASEVCPDYLSIKELKQSVETLPDFDTDDCTFDIHGNTICVEQIMETSSYSRPSVSMTLSCAQENALTQED